MSDFHKLYKLQGLTDEVITAFQNFIYSFYKSKKRNFPFRENITPYKIVVSEIMLQQTQTNQVAEKFLEFIKKFPDFISLAQASVEELLSAWQGLGYNRRALALKKIAECIINEYNGNVPKDLNALTSLPQIGHNTASSILSFAYNIPTYFIETNIRRVYIYFFFPGKSQIDDKEIMELVKNSIDKDNPRDWYYALMDYGTMLKKTHPELNKKSAHYRKQSKFDGSRRQVRGKILKLLLEKPLSIKEITDKIYFEKKKILEVLKTLKKEGFIQEGQEKFYIKN
ncbi:MAG: ArsR family transcriptional regulator [Candidatus Lokiarchaeota archaeon]|nr:ArsR family transcriptional regulator [Candidatus Lokiarchaeota archaeon]